MLWPFVANELKSLLYLLDVKTGVVDVVECDE